MIHGNCQNGWKNKFWEYIVNRQKTLIISGFFLVTIFVIYLLMWSFLENRKPEFVMRHSPFLSNAINANIYILNSGRIPEGDCKNNYLMRFDSNNVVRYIGNMILGDKVNCANAVWLLYLIHPRISKDNLDLYIATIKHILNKNKTKIGSARLGVQAVTLLIKAAPKDPRVFDLLLTGLESDERALRQLIDEIYEEKITPEYFLPL